MKSLWSLGLMGMIWIYFNRYGFTHLHWVFMKAMERIRPFADARRQQMKRWIANRKEQKDAEQLRQEWLRYTRVSRSLDIYRHE